MTTFFQGQWDMISFARSKGCDNISIQAENVCMIYLLTISRFSYTWRCNIKQRAQFPLYQNIWGKNRLAAMCSLSGLTKLSHAENDSIATALRKIRGHIGNQKKFLKAAPLLRQLFVEEKLSGAHGDLAFEVIRKIFWSAIFCHSMFVIARKIVTDNIMTFPIILLAMNEPLPLMALMETEKIRNNSTFSTDTDYL